MDYLSLKDLPLIASTSSRLLDTQERAMLMTFQGQVVFSGFPLRCHLVLLLKGELYTQDLFMEWPGKSWQYLKAS